MRTMLLSFLLFCTVSAAPPDVWQPECWCLVDVSDVLDADTVKGSIHLPFGGLLMTNRSIRAHGYDAWETSRRRRVLNLTEEQWQLEIQRGQKARKELVELLNGGRLYVSPIPQVEDIDPYDRVDARWLIVKDGVPCKVEDVAQQKGWVRK